MPYKDPGRQRAAIEKWRKRRVERLRKLKNKPCKDCGSRLHPAAMQWDHVGTDKEFNIMRRAHYAWQTVLKEIAKCELVCANCHAVRTFKRKQLTGSDKGSTLGC